MVYLLTTGVSAPRRSPSVTISRVSSWHVSALLVSLLKNQRLFLCVYARE